MVEYDISRNKAIALGFLNAIAIGDTDAIDSMLTADADWWVQGHGDFTRSHLTAALFATISRSSTRRMDVDAVTAEENRVAVTAQGEFVFAEGAYSNSYNFLFTITDGRIASGREYLDTQIAARFFAPPEAPAMG